MIITCSYVNIIQLLGGMQYDAISGKLLKTLKDQYSHGSISNGMTLASFVTLVCIISPGSRTSDNNNESLITKLSKWVDINNRRRMP